MGHAISEKDLIVLHFHLSTFWLNGFVDNIRMLILKSILFLPLFPSLNNVIVVEISVFSWRFTFKEQLEINIFYLFSKLLRLVLLSFDQANKLPYLPIASFNSVGIILQAILKFVISVQNVVWIILLFVILGARQRHLN